MRYLNFVQNSTCDSIEENVLPFVPVLLWEIYLKYFRFIQNEWRIYIENTSYLKSSFELERIPENLL